MIHLHERDWSIRQIAKQLAVGRRTVRRIIDVRNRARQVATASPIPARVPRVSKLDLYADRIQSILAEFPDARPKRVFEILRDDGFDGGYTIVKVYLRRIAPTPATKPADRFETEPGDQAQQDWAEYTLPFGKVIIFSYLLGYSRRQYLEVAEGLDFYDLIRGQVRAFDHLGGPARTCLYDCQKPVVIRWECGQPIYNTRFLSFATHYGMRPQACKPRTPEHKGKVERAFRFLETSFFNARKFRDRAHLVQALATWLQRRNDTRIHDTTRRRPIDLHAIERPHLLPLPAHGYDTAQVVYRIASVDGYVSWDGNYYSVPPQYITCALVLKVFERELVVYSPHIAPVARHALVDGGQGLRIQLAEHRVRHRRGDREHDLDLILEAFKNLGPAAMEFVNGLKRAQPRYLVHHLVQILELRRRYSGDDIAIALDHAVQYHAYDARAVTRVLTTQAQERSLEDPLPVRVQSRIAGWIKEHPQEPRSLTAYQKLLEDRGRTAPARKTDQENCNDYQGNDDREPEEAEAVPDAGDPGRGGESGSEGGV